MNSFGFRVKIYAVSKIEIRRLAPSDIADYRRVRLEALRNDPDNYGSTFEEESATPQLVFEKYILEQAPGNRMYGLFDGERLVGISGFFGDTRQRVLHRAKVTQVYVDPAYRGKGLAKRLLNYLIEEAFKIESLESLQLEAVDSNKTAIGLYQSLGFVSYGRFENYFKKLDGTYLDQQFMVLEKFVYQARNPSAENASLFGSVKGAGAHGSREEVDEYIEGQRSEW